MFCPERSSIRLTPIQTEGAAEASRWPRGKADLAVARGDLNLPANAESVVILRKERRRVWAPSGLPAKAQKTPAPRSSRSTNSPDIALASSAGRRPCHPAARHPHRIRVNADKVA